MPAFKLEFLDHVAINVKNMNEAADWYSNVLRLKKYQLKKWGEYPIFMFSGKTGVALFPANLNVKNKKVDSKSVRIDHSTTKNPYYEIKNLYTSNRTFLRYILSSPNTRTALF